MTYQPNPLDTSTIQLSAEILELTELLAKNTHENWARQRMAEGWRYGPQRDDSLKLHPCLVDYALLPEAEKEYDRISALETLKTITALGYRLVKTG
jgi:ryanodine receptor 2